MFVISIALTAWLFSGLPESFQQIREHEKVWNRKAHLGPFAPTFWFLGTLQLLCFVLGVVAFGAILLG
jgi:hypothetical protein